MLSKSTKSIELTRGYVVIVDADLYEWLNSYKWAAQDNGHGQIYASRFTSRKIKPRRQILMHRQITGADPNEVVDHLNHDTLDNRRANLRLCTQSENLANRSKLPSTNSSGFLGVSWAKWIGKWSAQITVQGRNMFLGHFDDAVEAARVRDRATLRYFGRHAFFNFPEDVNEE